MPGRTAKRHKSVGKRQEQARNSSEFTKQYLAQVMKLKNSFLKVIYHDPGNCSESKKPLAHSLMP